MTFGDQDPPSAGARAFRGPSFAGAGSFTSARTRRSGRRGHPWLKLFGVLVGVVVVVQWGLDPWAARIGGRFTPLGTWTGYGRVTASNRGTYELYVDLFGGGFATTTGRGRRCSGHGCDNLTGTAKLCGTAGLVETFSLGGAVAGLWTWSTDGAKTSLLLDGGRPQPLLRGDRIAWRGAWNGPDLALNNPDNSFTENVTPTGTLRTVTSTADMGTATVTLSPGDQTAFAQACSSLRKA